MGITVSLLAPDDAERQAARAGRRSRSRRRSTARATPALAVAIAAKRRVLCDKGSPTHGHLPENDNAGSPSGSGPPRAPATRPRSTSRTSSICRATSRRHMGGIPTVKLGGTLSFNNLEGARSTTRSPPASSPAWARPARPSRSPTAETSKRRKLDFDSTSSASARPPSARLQADPQLGAPRDPGGGLRSRRSRHVLLPHPPRHARSVRGDPVIDWKRHGSSPTSAPAVSWPDMSQDLPVDVMPCSNDEYFPETPTAAQ